MIICMVTSAHFPPNEGMGFYIWNLSRMLVAQGHHVQIITRSERHKPSYHSLEGISIWRPHFFPFYPLHVHLHGWFVQRLIEQLEPDVDLFHIHSPLVPPLRTSHPVMLSFHSTVRDDVRETQLNSGYTLLMKLQAPISYRLEVENIKKATVVNAISPRVAEALRNYPHCPPDVPVVWNGVDTTIFHPEQEKPSRRGSILSVGRLGPGKGLEDLIKAISLIPKLDTPITILGDGPLRSSLEADVKAYGLTNKVRFVGHITDRNQLAGFYQQACLFVLPSHHEGLPTVLLEAMACGCPVLATRVGGIPEVIQDGINGQLVPPKEPHQLAAAIEMLLADRSRLEGFGMRARQTIEQRFSWERISRTFADLYSSMLKASANLAA